MILHRIVHPDFPAPFDGEGARLHGGRWNPRGVPMLYYATTLALAALEKRVHVPAPALGRLWLAIAVEVPDALVPLADPAGLPPAWHAQPAPDATKAYGAQWAAALTSLGLRLPSIIIRSEHLALLNPLHPDLRRARHLGTTEFRFDERLAR